MWLEQNALGWADGANAGYDHEVDRLLHGTSQTSLINFWITSIDVVGNGLDAKLSSFRGGSVLEWRSLTEHVVKELRHG